MWSGWTVGRHAAQERHAVQRGDGLGRPGFGNVDGSGNDRPNLLNPSVLGRTIGNPDTAAGVAAEGGLCVPPPPERKPATWAATFPQGRHPECERGVVAGVGGAPGDAPYVARRID